MSTSTATATENAVALMNGFRDAFREQPGGVALITADPGEGLPLAALTATSVITLNVNPPLLAFSVSDISSTAPSIRAAKSVVVHLLDTASIHLARLGSTSGIDRFAQHDQWSRLPGGEPYFPQARVWIQGEVRDTFRADGATVIVVEGTSVGQRADQPSRDAQPLVYHNRGWHQLGDELAS